MTERGTFRRSTSSVLLSAVATWAAFAAAPAQGQTIRGTLMEFGSDEPIDLGLIIMISETGDSVTSTLSNASGFFEVTAPDPGNYLLQAAALGYRETQVGLFELGVGGEISVQFRLWAAPLEIDGLMVESLVQQPELVRNGFYRRMQRGVGTFFTPDQVKNAPELRAIEMLQGLSGVRMTIDAQGRERLLVRGSSGYCVPTIFVDGVRTEWANVDMSLDVIVPMEMIYAVEVHRGVSGTPIEFGSFNDCGVLVFWTLRARR